MCAEGAGVFSCAEVNLQHRSTRPLAGPVTTIHTLLTTKAADVLANLRAGLPSLHRPLLCTDDDDE